MSVRSVAVLAAQGFDITKPAASLGPVDNPSPVRGRASFQGSVAPLPFAPESHGGPSVDPRHGASRSSALALRHEARVVTSGSFDWDDNIFNMPTEVAIFSKSGLPVRRFRTHDFAIVRLQLGQPGPYESYELRAESFASMADDPAGKRNPFVDDIDRALSKGGTAWQGPAWRSFVEACSTAAGAARTTIITARLHSPESLHAGLLRLHALGLIAFVPPLENLYPVSYPPLAAALGSGSLANPAEAKSRVMHNLLDALESQARREHSRGPSGRGTARQYRWHFSDDDFGNFDKAQQSLAASLAAGRWQHLRISLEFTGHNHPTEKPRRIELLRP